MIKWFNRLNIQSKLFGIMSLMIFIGALITMWNVYSIVRIDIDTEKMVVENKLTEEIEEAQAYFLMMELNEKDFLLTGDEKYVDKHEANRTLVDLFLRNSLLDAETIEEKTQIYDLQREKERYEEIYTEVVEAYRHEDFQEAVRISVEESDEIIQQVHHDMEHIIHETVALLEANAHEADLLARWSVIIGAAGLVIFIVLAAVAALITIQQLSRPLLSLDQAIAAIGRGEFQENMLEGLIHRNDEVGQLARVVDDLDQTIQQRERELRQEAARIRAEIEGE